MRVTKYKVRTVVRRIRTKCNVTVELEITHSPLGAVFETCDLKTHHADVTILAFHAFEWHTVAAPASSRVLSGIGATPLASRFRTMHDAAPCKSAWT